MRFPWTIWRFTSGELWRLILLTTGVVVLVTAFCATVKPMAEGKLGSAEAARFLLYAIPPMLQYVLPFAAGFASTIAFHRMASDNELEAARVGGVGYHTLLAPAAGAGVALAVGMAVLSGEVVPRFLRSMEEIIQQDLTRILVSSVERGESVRMDDLLVFADRIYSLGPDKQSGSYNVLVLTRFAAVKLEKKTGEVTGGATAERAWVWLARDASAEEPSTVVTVSLENASGDLPGLRGRSEGASFSRRLPSPFRDDVKFMTWEQLRRLPKNPDLHAGVDSRRRVLAHALARGECLRTIGEELRSQRRARLVGQGRTVLVRGSGLILDGSRWVVAPGAPGGPVEVDVIDERDGAPGGLTRLAAESAHFSTGVDDPSNPRPTLTLHLRAVRVLGADGTDTDTDDPARDYGGLTPGEDPSDALLAMGSHELIETARARLAAGADPEVNRAASELRRRLGFLEREITGRVHERAAMAVSCLVMVLTGCVTAIRLKDRLPLPVYLWSFFPGIGAVLTVNAGKEMVRSLGSPGLLLLWGGLLALTIYAGVVYSAIRRH